MKRTTLWILVFSGALLLAGCWPYWHDEGRGGREHGRYFGEDRGGSQEYHR
ncbi:hypothetical protein [Pseudomonas sp. FEN]|uniref:hypothetical protein n=1 Tax=Pseudomonas sp. FEN TaxID=2767468 RepID=UPI00174CE510|nr:hypothetical protein [Pseudomonas sp. FEN]